eukprot:g5761.t1
MSSCNRVENCRQLLEQVPVREYFEVPGKPDAIFEIRDYSKDPEKGAETARSDLPFLFKPFEVGQKPPPTKGQKPPFGREPTIHEYLDWTVTAASNLDSLDFSGFRVLTLLPRYRPNWPPPDNDDNVGTKVRSNLGAPLDPIPLLTPFGKPISAATIRSGNGYLEVPFFATKQSARGKGYGRALLYAIEDICRFLGMTRIMLCSTDDPQTISTWKHLGFRHSEPNELTEWGIAPTHLVHMTNTVQMVKLVQEIPNWRALRVKHQGFEQRIYFINKVNSSNLTGQKRKEESSPQNNSSPNKIQRLEEIKGATSSTPGSPKNGVVVTSEDLPSFWKRPNAEEIGDSGSENPDRDQKKTTTTTNLVPSEHLHPNKKETVVVNLASEFV